MPVHRVLQIGSDVADALSAAHERGIVHRDLKPANVIVSDSGQVKVLDFGLAKVQLAREALKPSELTFMPTEAGVLLGTPGYMSPEQISGIVDVDHRTDIFPRGPSL
jgi:serine/threonine protein kinase